jgi:hypothetical protein
LLTTCHKVENKVVSNLKKFKGDNMGLIIVLIVLVTSMIKCALEEIEEDKKDVKNKQK